MIKGSVKNMTEASWREYYKDSINFYKLFKDYRMLRDAAERRPLSSSEEAQKRVIDELIDNKLA